MSGKGAGHHHKNVPRGDPEANRGRNRTFQVTVPESCAQFLRAKANEEGKSVETMLRARLVREWKEAT